MLNFEDADVGAELASLDMSIDWNEDDILNDIPTPLPFDSPLHEANLTLEEQEQGLESFINFENFQTQNAVEPLTELAAPPNPPVQDLVGSLAENIAVNPLVLDDPYSLPPLPPSLSDYSVPIHNDTQLDHSPLSAAVGLIQGHDTAQTGYLNQFSDMENEDFQMLQCIGITAEHNPSNPQLVPNLSENIDFSGINQQSSPYPALFHPNPIEAGPGIEIGNSSGQLVTTQSSALYPLQNHNINPHVAWNSWPEHNQFSAPNVYGSKDAPNYMQSPQSVTTQLNQGGHASEMKQIFDLQSQNSMRPVYPMHPRYPPFYDTRDNHHHPQVMMPNDHGQQSAPMQHSRSQDVQNQKTNTPNLQWQSNTLHGSPSVPSNFTSSQALSSRILGHSGTTRTTQGTISQVSRSRESEIQHLLSGHQVPPVSANGVPTQRDKGKLPESSSTRTQPSEAIRRILNMNPKRMVPPTQLNGKGRYVPPRRGRPPKRREEGESSLGKSRKVASKTGNAGTTSGSQEKQKTTDNVENKDQNTNTTNPPSAPRQFLNAIYHPKFERNGDPIDPHLRLFKPPPEK